MRAHVLGAALAAVLIVSLPVSAGADIVDLTDGKDNLRLPKNVISPYGTVPSDAELRETAQRTVELAYDSVKLGRQVIGADQIVDVYVTAAFANEDFNNGEKYGVSGFWAEAAEAFRLAAQELTGQAEQLALYKRMLATANTGKDNATLRAANDLLASNEKTYYFGPAHEVRARIYARGGKMKEAVAALKKVIEAPGMNARDLFSAKYFQTWLSRSVGADSMEKWTAAERSYRDLLAEIGRHPRKQLSQVPQFRALMSLGEALRGQGKSDAARKIFDQILAEANESTDPGVLAGVYYGLGDVVFEEAAALQSTGGSSPKAREKVTALLDQSALHYLRVVLLYSEYADAREIFGATRGAARVLRNIFQVGGEKDCDVARRAYDYYRQAVQMMDRGEERRLLVREGIALKERIAEVCEPAAAEGAPAGEGAESKD